MGMVLRAAGHSRCLISHHENHMNFKAGVFVFLKKLGKHAPYDGQQSFTGFILSKSPPLGTRSCFFQLSSLSSFVSLLGACCTGLEIAKVGFLREITLCTMKIAPLALDRVWHNTGGEIDALLSTSVSS